MTKRNIAVIGAGAKAAAIAAKAHCIRQEGIGDVHVSIFEKKNAGANWTGSAGYTDGVQLLCTPAERDLGFPYQSEFGAPISHRMQANYSWMAYAVRSNLHASWINRGSPPINHTQFASYISDAILRSEAELVDRFEVTGLVPNANGLWRVEGVSMEGGESAGYEWFDGVVITGPGPAQSCFGTLIHSALMNGENFWLQLDLARALLAPASSEVAIVGGGGAAAAAAAWLVQNGFGNRTIYFIHDSAAIYTRSSSLFENQVFDDEVVWASLSDAKRQSFVNRLTRSVVWEAVAKVLETATRLRLVPGRASGATPMTTFAPDGNLTVHVKPSRTGPTIDIPAHLVIDATGFDKWWFRRLLPAPLGTLQNSELEQVVKAMGDDLDLRLANVPPLHVPGVAQIVGPAFTSLMALDRTSDRILAPYVRASRL